MLRWQKVWISTHNHTAGAPNRIPFYFLLVPEENNTSHFFDAPIKLPEVIEAIVRRIHTGMHRSLLVSLQHLRVDRLNRIDSLSLSPPAGKRTQQIWPSSECSGQCINPFPYLMGEEVPWAQNASESNGMEVCFLETFGIFHIWRTSGCVDRGTVCAGGHGNCPEL